MTEHRSDHPSTTESRIANRAMRGRLDERAVNHPAGAGLTEEPTSPRGNQPLDVRRVAQAHEDFQRVLGN
jgi:hypothetical protein